MRKRACDEDALVADFFGSDRKAGEGADRKLKQLCREVLRVAETTIWEDGATFLEVVPAPDGSRLALRVAVLSGADRAEVAARLERRKGELRAEVAAALQRKRTPELVFELLGELPVVP